MGGFIQIGFRKNYWPFCVTEFSRFFVLLLIFDGSVENVPRDGITLRNIQKKVDNGLNNNSNSIHQQ